MSGRAYGLRECAVPRCPARIGQQFLMCVEHWKLVPRSIQGRVLKAFADAKNLPDDADRLRAREVGETLRAAQAEAVKAVAEKGGGA